MQEIESAVRDLGGSAMQGIDHAVKGLNSGTCLLYTSPSPRDA